MLAILRVIALFFAFILINIVVLVVCVLRPFHKNNVHFAGNAYAQMSRIMGLKIIVRKSDAVKEDTPYVLIANHQSSYDIITICKAALPGVVTIGKKSLKWIPVFGQIYWLSGNIMIDRKNSGKARDTLKIAGKKIREKGTSVWVFPEGTRSYGRGLLPFKSGAFWLAQAVKVPVVMVTASDLHEKVKWNRWNNGVVLIDIDAPVELTREHSPKGWTEHFHKAMEEKFARLNEEVAQIESAKR
ncbi:1-acylglycerol-3-phosphate O-acyltransferase [Alteromonas sp. RKMC-009]|uniref:1-acylglycerol-3-phosphate O-acyltransferase n=1 Tax=Alteromonas sp. RKMC-009 TaxID=2267264 RepID=UPI000C62E1A7|nr:1-acylglycerol-3-phosphate O-acyltransferase [Alteromonas sp. RKMC-009]AYA65455.1 1-acylglycerol-3-phosphate O-acyltransferase [Alteromonas sp. RKMC-009]MBT80564.1 1-acyl-sn-glycerol-3-phosphate acyltransferase [Alteromonadaceae bacterium]MEC7689269.1 1-acylglycerol-3-phosphate O-acyltransferase [Pseudomonadota bacterium]